MKNAPILLTGAENLNNETKKEITRLGAKNVYVIGGTGVVSKNVVSELKAMNLNVDRISGDTRYTTALEVAKRLGNVSEIAVVNGVTGLADAVSIAPVAADRNMPIVLSSPNEGTKVFDEFIKVNSIKTSYVIGGEAAISKDVAFKLPNANRLGGASRNETNAIILEKFYTNRDLNNIFVAKDGMKKVIVNFERPTEDGFDSARCELPDYKWTERQGYSDEEIAMFEELLHSNAHLLYRYAENGGIQIA